MADEKYYKVAESDLVAIADAIRLQKGSDKKYALKDMPKVIGAMLVLPSGVAETSVQMSAINASAVGIRPTVVKGAVNSDAIYISVNASAVGTLTEE